MQILMQKKVKFR